METVVADTCSLVSLAVPKALAAYDASVQPDPLADLLTSCTVIVPTQVVAELETMAQYDDVDAAAATNVLAAEAHYETENPIERDDTGSSLPDYGLDDGETAAIVLANARSVDALLTDEFADSNFTLVHSRLGDAKLVTTPRLLREFERAEHLSSEAARTLLDTIASRRWGQSAYVQQVRETLNENT